jgi:microcystin-dependent protein
MTEPYLGEIRMFGGNFAPRGWVMCDGQLLSIAENDTLYVLLGTTYGGDGQNTFGVPDLRGRVPTHQGSRSGQSYVIGQLAGSESVTLNPSQLPSHTHPTFAVSVAGAVAVPTAATMISDQGPAGQNISAYAPYNSANEQIALSANSTSLAGGNQPHNNMQPYVGVNFILAIAGIFPPQN